MCFICSKCTSIQLCTQVTAISHFQTQPLSSLVSAALEGPTALSDACANVDPAILRHAQSLLSLQSATHPHTLTSPRQPKSHPADARENDPATDARTQTPRMATRASPGALLVPGPETRADDSRQHGSPRQTGGLKARKGRKGDADHAKTAQELAEAVSLVMQKWSCWAGCLHLLHAAAKAAGFKAGRLLPWRLRLYMCR